MSDTNWVLRFAAYLQTIGPFTAPLCLALAAGGYAVIKWLLDDRKRLHEELKVALSDATNLRERRANDLSAAAGEIQETANEYRNHTAATREVLQSLSNRIDRLLARREGE